MSIVRQDLNPLLKKIAKQQQYENYEVAIKSCSSDGGNFTSDLFKVTLTAPHNSHLSLFCKIATMGEKIRSQLPMPIYSTELLFYADILKKYEELQKKHNIPVEHMLTTSKFFGSSPTYLKEIVVLEDLTAAGYTTTNRLVSVDWSYASKAVEELAKLHALSLACGEENPIYMEEILKENTVCYELTADIKSGLENTLSMALNKMKDEYKPKVIKFAEENMRQEIFMKYYKPNRSFLIHGEYKTTNLMHKINSDGSYKIAILDFQMIRTGSPVLDVLHFVFTATDGAFRRHHYQQLVDHYYSQLAAALRRLHQNIDKLYPREEFDRELKELLPFGLNVALFVLPVILVETDEAPSFEGSSDFGQFSIKGSSVYEDRLNGILSDYVAWGVL